MTDHSKPRVDFYKLAGQNRTSLNRFCCQLADKVVRMGRSVFIRTPDMAETRILDDMMWTFSDTSFLPHRRLDDQDADAPVVIGHTAAPVGGYLLINLSEELPENLHAYERVAEIINEAPDKLQKGRLRYSTYKNGAYKLHYHEITA